MALHRRRHAAVAVLTAIALFAAITSSLWSIRADVPYLTPVFTAASLIPAVLGLATGRRWLLVPGAVFAAGVATVSGGVLANGAVCFQPVANGWSLTYEWRANVVTFGPSTATSDPLCRAAPNRPLVGLGYLLATLGAYELSLLRTEPGPLTTLSRRVRKQWYAEN